MVLAIREAEEDVKVQLFNQAHGNGKPHLGVLKTWTEIKKIAPDSNVTNQDIQIMIENCGTCNKMRTALQQGIPSEVPRFLVKETDNTHSIIGIDILSISPTSNGMNYLVVIVNLFTKLVFYCFHSGCEPPVSPYIYIYIVPVGLCRAVLLRFVSIGS